MYNINFKREPVYQFGSLFLYLCCFAIDDGFALYSKGNYIKIKYRRITNYTQISENSNRNFLRAKFYWPRRFSKR